MSAPAPPARRLGWPWLALCAALALGLGLLLGEGLRRDQGSRPQDSSEAAGIGGDFTLVGPGGAAVRLADYRGRVVMVFFGYTYCPDICPEFLHGMQVLRKGLGEDAKHFTAILVSVDPARDTPARLQEYVRYFDPDFVGLTGSKAVIDQVVSAYGAAYSIGAPDASGAYVVDHTSLGYLVDGQGRVRHLVPQGISLDEQLALVRALIRELPAP